MVRKVRTRRCAHKEIGGSSVRKSDDIGDERVLYINKMHLAANLSIGRFYLGIRVEVAPNPVSFPLRGLDFKISRYRSRQGSTFPDFTSK